MELRWHLGRAVHGSQSVNESRPFCHPFARNAHLFSLGMKKLF